MANQIAATLHFQVIKKRKIVMTVTGFYVTMQKTGQEASAIHCPMYKKIHYVIYYQSIQNNFSTQS